MTFGKSITKVKALKLSFIAIASVVVVEGIVGLVTNSLAILSDSAHALFDSVTTLILLVTTRMSLKPADEEHLYGHGKIEPIGGLIGGVALIGLAGFLFYEAITRILLIGQVGQSVNHDPAGFLAVAYTLTVDFFRISTLWGRGESSVTVKASFYHALSDLASTIIALLGFGLTYIGLPDQIDATASIVLCVLLVYLTTGLIRSSSFELSDSISKNAVSDIKKEILNTPGVSICRDLKARKVGDKTYVETTICVLNSMGLAEAHDIASQIEANVIKSHGNSAVTVHIEPIGKEKPIEKEIEALAIEVEGVREVHNISNVYSKGKLLVTLHTLVDSQLSVEEAHNIAEKIENNLKEKIENITNVTVHLEPNLPKISQEFAVDDAEVQRIVKRLVEAHPDILKVNRVVTYIGEKQRYINVDCFFDKSITVDAMHETVSRIEWEIKKTFREAVVTIHGEPLPK
jgi:cation diffusion facilitator family transporter